MKPRRARSLLLIAAVFHGLVYVLLLPAWMGEDEPWHVEYTHHLATGHVPWGGVVMQGAEREEFFQKAVGDHAIPRPGRAEEVAQAILFLLQNDFTTGTVVDVDGGASLP